MGRGRFDQRAREIGLTRAQWQAVATIHRCEGATQREIANNLDVSSVTIGRILERLEADGWIERQADTVDRRAYRLFLKPAARPILDQLGEIAKDEEQLSLAGINEQERALLNGLLDRIIDNLEQRGKPFDQLPVPPSTRSSHCT